jgi:hypothetical protein
MFFHIFQRGLLQREELKHDILISNHKGCDIRLIPDNNC